MPTTTTATCTPDLDDDWRIEVTHRYTPGWLGRLLRQKPAQRQQIYVGKGWDWREYPYMDRPRPETTGRLHATWDAELARQLRRAKGDANV